MISYLIIPVLMLAWLIVFVTGVYSLGNRDAMVAWLQTAGAVSIASVIAIGGLMLLGHA